VSEPVIVIYTDGSYSPMHGTGTWVALVMVAEVPFVLSGVVPQTTQHRMELTAIIQGIEYLVKSDHAFSGITIITDSQYAAGLSGRKNKLEAHGLKTSKDVDIRNADLVAVLFQYIQELPLRFEKVKAHARQADIPNYNREADKLARALLRKAVAALV